jgi:hypothetical protein
MDSDPQAQRDPKHGRLPLGLSFTLSLFLL